MFAPRHIHRAAVGCGLVCTLLLAAVMSPAAAADPGPQDERSAAARGGARTSSIARTPSTPRQDLRGPDSRDGARAEDIALAQERYLSSYRESQPLAPPQSRVGSDGMRWLPLAATLAIVLAGAARLCQLGIGRARTA